MNSEIYCNFPKVKKATVLVRKFTICTTYVPISGFLKIIVHSLGLGPSTRRIQIRLNASKRSKRAKNFAFSNHKCHNCFSWSHVSSIFLNFSEFLEYFNFPEITLKESGFPTIQEISFKVGTLWGNLHFSGLLPRDKIRGGASAPPLIVRARRALIEARRADLGNEHVWGPKNTKFGFAVKKCSNTYIL